MELIKKLIVVNGKEKWVDGYFLTLKQLAQLVRDFQADCHDGFVSNDEAYLVERLKKMKYE